MGQSEDQEDHGEKKDELDEDEFTMEMIDAGAEDVEVDGDIITVSSEMNEFGSISKKLAELSVEPMEAGLQRIPVTTKEVTKESYDKIMKLIDVIEDDDDVQKVYHNIEFDESFLEG